MSYLRQKHTILRSASEIKPSSMDICAQSIIDFQRDSSCFGAFAQFVPEMSPTQTVDFDEERKIWKSCEEPNWDFITQTLGEAFLKRMRTIESTKVLEHHFDTGLERTAGEIYRDAVTVASNLTKLGVTKGDVVVLYTVNNPIVSALAFGCYMIGAVVTYFDTKLPPDYIDYTLQLAEPMVIVFEENYRKDLYGSLARSPLKTLKHALSIDGKALPNVVSQLLLSISPNAIDLFQSVDLGDPQHATASYALTSGSTGCPKLVVLSHSVMLHGLITWWGGARSNEQVTTDSVLFSFSPLRWISQIQLMFQSLILGAIRVCATGPPEAVYGREITRRTGITHFFTGPGTFHDMLLSVADTDTVTFASLRCVMLSGDHTPHEVINLMRKLVPDCKVYRGYGMTEISTTIGVHEDINGGIPLPGLEVMVLNDNQQPLGYNCSGQLCFRTFLPFGGYLKVDRSKYLLPDGFFVSGDYGFMDGENNLHMQARYNDLVRAGSVILIPNTIEVVVNSLPEVAIAVLAGFQKTPADKDDIGALFVVLRSDVSASPESLRVRIRAVLSTKLTSDEVDIIRDIHFIEKVPLTSSGKVVRSALRRQLASQMLKN